MSPDKRLIAQMNGSQINLFENNTYRPLARFKEVSNAEAFFSDDSRLLVAKNTSRKLVVYDLTSLSVLTALKLRRGSSNGDGEACISPDNQYVINLGYDFPYGYISIYDIACGQETRLRADKREVYHHIRYIPSRGKYFIDGFRRPAPGTEGNNQYFYLWLDGRDGSFEQTFSKQADAEFLYADRLGEVLSFTQTGADAFHIFPPNRALPVEKRADTLCVALSHDNTRMAVYQGKELKLCTFPDMAILQTFPDIGYGRVSFSPDDKELLVASAKGFIYKIA